MPIFKDADIYWGGYDLSATANEVNIDANAATVPVTTFGSGGNVTNIGGLKEYPASVMTYIDQATTTPALSAQQGTIDVFSVIPWPSNSGVPAVGDQAYCGRALLKTMKIPAKVGDAAQLNADLVVATSEGLLDSWVMFPLASVSSSGNGTGNQTGAQASPKVVYLAVHVTALSGDRTLTVKLQSATANTFSGATDRVTLGAISALGTGFGSSSTATTDTWWRIVYTLGGTTGSVSFAAFMAIQ